MKTSAQGIEFILEFEGFRPYWYDDADGKKIQYAGQIAKGTWTIGFGTVYKSIAHKILHPLKPGTSISKNEAHQMAKPHIEVAENWVKSRLKRPLTQNEFDAVVSHTYNTGGSNNLMKLVNNGGEITYNGKKYSLERWWKETYITNSGTDQKMNGLVRRRKEEYEMFVGVKKKCPHCHRLIL